MSFSNTLASVTPKAASTKPLISTKAKIQAVISIPSADGVARTFTISEGDIVKGLTFSQNGITRTVSGVVTIIQYSISGTESKNTACNCKRGSDFADRVRITGLIVDSSDTYSADVNSIAVNSIIGLESVNVSALGVDDVEIVKAGELTFTCAMAPDSILWNNKVVPFTQDGDDKYVAQIDTMNKENSLLIFSGDRFCNMAVDGLEPEPDRDECIRNALLSAIVSAAANADDAPEKQMVVVAANVGQVDELLVGDEDGENLMYLADTEVHTVNSTDNMMTTPAFEVTEDGLLKVAAQVIMNGANVEGFAGHAVLHFNGFAIEIPATIDDAANIAVNAVAGGGKGDPYTNVVVAEAATVHNLPGVTVMHHRQDGSAYVAIQAALDGVDIPDDAPTYVVGDNLSRVGTFGNMKMLYNSDAVGAFTDEEQLEPSIFDYIFNVVGYGSFGVTINTEESIHVYTIGDSATFVEVLADPDAMCIKLDADVEVAEGVTANRAGVVIDGNGHKLTCNSVKNGSAGVLIMSDNVTVRNLTVDVSGDYAIKAYAKDGILLEGITAVSATKGAIQVNGSEVTLRGTIVVNGAWGGIEVCKSSSGAVPMLDVSADKILNQSLGGVPAVWVDKVEADGLQNAIINTTGILTKVALPADKAGEDQIWFN